MSLFICIPRKLTKVELMISTITLLKNGIYDHVVTLLITNKGAAANELLMLYPHTFQQDIKPESILRTLKSHSQLKKGEHDIDWDIVETYDPEPAGPFNFRNPDADGYDYRGLRINGVRYDGWVKYEPTIDRVDVGLDLLHKFTSRTSGYSIFRVVFDENYPIKTNMPIWVRIKFTVDSHAKGLLPRWAQGYLGSPKYSYQFYNPYDIRAIFLDELEKLNADEAEDQRSLESLSKLIDPVKKVSLVDYSQYHLYIRFKEIDGDSNPVMNSELQVKDAVIGGCKDRCYKLFSPSLSHISKGAATNVYAKEEMTWLKVIKVIPWPKGD